MAEASGRKSGRLLFFSYLGVFLAVILDQAAKYLAAAHLKGQPAMELIPGVFELSYLENESAAFGLDPVSLLHRIFHFGFFDANPQAFLACKMIFFLICTLIVAFFLMRVYRRIPWNRHFLPMNLIVLSLLSGAFGNLIDRVLHRYVIDFFYFKLIDFPVFNVADIYVTVAAFSLAFVMFFVYREEDFAVLFPGRGKGAHADAE